MLLVVEISDDEIEKFDFNWEKRNNRLTIVLFAFFQQLETGRKKKIENRN